MMKPVGRTIALLLLPLLGGCAVLGYIAAVAPKGETAARYVGLAGQRVAVLTWADRGAIFNYQTIGADVRSDVSSSVIGKLKAQVKAEELKGTTYVEPRQVYRWQRDHPEMEGRPAAEVAASLAAAVGASRVIYLELGQFTTRNTSTEMLLKGAANVTIQVAEIAGTSARMAYEEAGLNVEFPPKAPEGVPQTEQINETYVYRGLVEAISNEVSVRFFPYYE